MCRGQEIHLIVRKAHTQKGLAVKSCLHRQKRDLNADCIREQQWVDPACLTGDNTINNAPHSNENKGSSLVDRELYLPIRHIFIFVSEGENIHMTMTSGGDPMAL